MARTPNKHGFNGIIRDNHYYILKEHPGISGFTQWDKWEYRITTGKKVRAGYKLDVAKEYLAKGTGKFRLEDGHFPEYQPIVSEVEMLRWLDANPFSCAVPLQ